MRFNAAFSSTPYFGRGAFLPESPVLLGSTRTFRPARSRNAMPSGLPQSDQLARDFRARRGRYYLVIHHANLFAPPAARQHGIHKVRAALAPAEMMSVNSRHPHHKMARSGGQRKKLAGQLAVAVDAQRARRIGFNKRRAFFSSKTKTSRCMYQLSPQS